MRRLRENTQLKSTTKKYTFILVVFGIIGVVTILISNASSSSISIEAESGAMSGSIGLVCDNSASGSSGVIFGSTQACQDIFVSTTGSDTKNGSTQAEAVKTINKAVQLATGNTRIRIMAGTYIETVRIQKNNIRIEPFGDGDVTINGAIPQFITGVAWTRVQNGIYRHDLGRDEFSSQGNTIYAADGQQQWSYDSLNELKNRQTVNNLPGVFINNNFFAGSLGVYVATNTDQAPSAPLYIGSNESTIDIANSDNVTISGLSNSKLKITYGNYNIQAKNSSNIKITNVDITGGRSGIAIYDTSNVLIKDNEIHGAFGRNWDWADVKEYSQSTMENQGIHVKTYTKNMTSIVTDGNNVSGYFNSVNYSRDYPQSGPYYASAYSIDDSVISNNILHDSIDDGIEIDGKYRNLVVKSNKVYDTYSPFSATGSKIGPVYVYENLFVADRVISDDHGAIQKGPSYALKMNGEAEQTENKNMHLYHNTFYFAGNSNHRRTIESLTNSITTDVSFINNIFYSTEGGILRGTGRAQDDIEFDGNIFYSEVNDPDNYYAWNSFYDSLHSYSSLASILSGGALPSQWQGNAEGNPNLNCIDPENSSCFRPTAPIAVPASLQPIPNGFAESARLNSKTRVGAFE